MPSNYNWIIPTWPAPKNVQALTTVRQAGLSLKPYDSFNLALHVGDDVNAVLANRQLLKVQANLPNDPLWLNQVHGTTVVDVNDFRNPHPIIEADASVAFQPNQVCAVLTADCLPVLLCNQAGTQISAIHAGWRGLSNGIVEAAVERFTGPQESILAWLGPAIGPRVFEVGEEVLLAFKEQGGTAFTAKEPGKWLADIYQLARQRLARLGITQVYGGDYCSYQDPERFYSYRRSKQTGRMASLIWLEDRVQ